MKNHSASLVVVLFLGQSLDAFAYAPSSNLGKRWDFEKSNPTHKPESSIVDIYRGRHVLFVAGFLNELSPDYFHVGTQVIQQDFSATTSLERPSSLNPISEDAVDLYSRVMQVYAQNGKPIVLCGHSKGGAGVLYMILQHPELVLNGIVDKVVIMQGVIGGSPVANLIEDQALAKNLPDTLKEGLASMVPSVTKNLFDTAWSAFHASLTGEQQAEVSHKIFYVRSSTDIAHVSPLLSWTHLYLVGQGILSYGDWRNDGLLLANDQMYSKIGTDLGVVLVDHVGPVVGFPMSNTSELDKAAFTRALFQEIYLQ